MDNKKKNIYILVLVGGILMVVINIVLFLIGGGGTSMIFGLIAGIAFIISAIANLNKIKKNNIQ